MFQSMSFELKIAISAVAVAIIGVAGTWWAIFLNNRHNKLMAFNDLQGRFFDILKEIDDIADNSKLLGTEQANRAISWDYRLFNLCEYICYIGNRDRIIKNHILGFMKKALISNHKRMKSGFKLDGKFQHYVGIENYTEWDKFMEDYI